VRFKAHLAWHVEALDCECVKKNQRGFGLSTPSGEEREGATPTGRRPVTQDTGGSVRADNEGHTSPEENPHCVVNPTAFRYKKGDDPPSPAFLATHKLPLLLSFLG
jgi:hypothetical protein